MSFINNIELSNQIISQLPRMYSKSPRALTRHESQQCNPQRDTSQSRIRQRVTSSPLKLPLQNAISKVISPRDNTADKINTSRMLVKSRMREQRDNSTSRVISRNIYKDEPEYMRQKMHTETATFLKKYFTLTADYIPVQSLIQCIVREYEYLWGTQNSSQIFDDFNYKIYEIFGENVEIRELLKRTLNDGMIGLILQIFKQIKNEQKIRSSNYLSVSKNPKIQNLKQSFEQQLITVENLQNIKNIIQQFMETMYQCMENQIYNKFNIQMRRMVIKYREAERIMKKINQKINMHADVFQYQILYKNKKKQFQENLALHKREIQTLSRELFKERSNYQVQRRHNSKLEEENRKLKQNLQKFQNAVLTKVMQPTPAPFIDTTLSRRISSNSTICDKQNMVPGNQEPFKITIDTHVIQKDGQPPQTKTYATLYGLNNITKGMPIQINDTPNTESRIIHNNYTTTSNIHSPYDYQYGRSSPINMLSRRL